MNKNKGIKDKKKLDKERDTNNIQKDKIEKKGIYIHIPFCKQKCGYCDFHSFAKIEDLKEEYVEALCNEIKEFSKHIPDEDKYIDTIFFRRSEHQVC
jgi:putative coproporphyrinogen dehydrogenase